MKGKFKKKLIHLRLLVTVNCILIIWSNLVNCEVTGNKEQLINRINKRQSNSSSSRINRITSTLGNQSNINSKHLIAILRSFEIEETTIRVNWRLKVFNYNSSSSQPNVKMKTVDQHVYLPTEWTLRVRQFGTLHVKLRFISEIIDYSKLLITGFKDINFNVSSLNDGVAFELCLESKEFLVHDETDTLLRRVSLINNHGEPELDGPGSQRVSRMVCKEVVTRRSSCGNTLTPSKIAAVTVVSSASTIVIVVVGWCWWPSNKNKSDDQNDEDVHRSENDDESIGNDRDDQPQQVNNKRRKTNWFKWFRSSPTVTVNQHRNGNNQRKIGKSLMVNNINYENNNNYKVKKANNWLFLWRKIKQPDQPIMFTKNFDTINIGIRCPPISTSIYRPKSWP